MMVNTIKDPLWFEAEDPVFQECAEIMQIIRACFVDDLPFIVFNHKYKNAGHPFYREISPVPFNFTCTSTQGALLDVRTTNELISLQSLIGTRDVNNVTITGTSSPVQSILITRLCHYNHIT